MKMKSKLLQKTSLLTSSLLAASLLASPVMAKMTEAEIARLGKDLTYSGAEMAGNAEGTIPAYTGGLKGTPACDKADTFLCNPYAADKPLFEITAKNVAEHKDKLGAGLLAMFENYPETFKIPVYPTRRSTNVPDHVKKATLRNAAVVETINDGNGVSNFEYPGYPFPIPKNGLEVFWNHQLGYHGDTASRYAGLAAPQVNGDYSMVMMKEALAYRTGISDLKPGEDENAYLFGYQVIMSPARLAGNVIMVHETIDQVKGPRRSWIYNTGQRRVRRAPQFAYDAPFTAADGLRTIDGSGGFNGAPDRYNWTLVGKKEMYVPANNYKLDEKGLKYDDIIQPGHINSDLTRYELRRVWVVEANLKEGVRHIYKRRTLYFDEDSWLIVLVDHYDSHDELWRLHVSYALQSYNGQVPWWAAEEVVDFNAKRYVISGLENEEVTGQQFNNEDFKKVNFKPAALRRLGVR